MPPRTDTLQVPPYEIDEVRHRVIVRRHLAASAEQAFAFWTEPRHVSLWWDPSGAPLAECTIDLRVGGQLRFVTAGHAGPPFVGRYLEIEPPTRIVFQAMGATGTVSIRPAEQGAEVVVEIRAADAQTLKALVDMGVAEGTAQTLDNLRAYAARQG